MHIVYAVTTCSDPVYEKLFRDAGKKPAFQSQKYHRLLIEGLAAGARVDVVANLPINKNLMQKARLTIPDEVQGGASYHYIAAVRSPLLKPLVVGFGTFFGTLRRAHRDSAVVVDCLNRVAALSGLLAAKVRGIPCVGIVTDLPDMLGGGRFSKAMANFVIRHCSHYVLLTEAIADYLNQKHKPYVVLEGQADIAMKAKKPSLSEKIHPRVCMYAGGISALYGLKNLVEGFLLADLPDTQLHIYGQGDYVEELQRIEDPRVCYGGMLLSSEVVEKERQATLMVNPRPTDQEYVKYSFPSKTMEYMAAGTPLLTTVLPGMPKEYYPYVYFIREETPEGIAEALRRVLAESDQELLEKGQMARSFVLDTRNNVVQGAKILKMLETTRDNRGGKQV